MFIPCIAGTLPAIKRYIVIKKTHFQSGIESLENNLPPLYLLTFFLFPLLSSLFPLPSLLFPLISLLPKISITYIKASVKNMSVLYIKLIHLPQ